MRAYFGYSAREVSGAGLLPAANGPSADSSRHRRHFDQLTVIHPASQGAEDSELFKCLLRSDLVRAVRRGVSYSHETPLAELQHPRPHGLDSEINVVTRPPETWLAYFCRVQGENLCHESTIRQIPTSSEVLDVSVQKCCSALNRCTVVLVAPQPCRRIPNQWMQRVSCHRRS